MGQAAFSLADASPRVLSERSKQLGRTLNGSPPSQREISTLEGGYNASSSSYAAVNPEYSIPELMCRMKCHAWIAWLVLPSWAFSQAMFPGFHATRENGYSNAAFVVVALVEAHRLCSESKAWGLATGILSQPERIVMRQLHIYKARWHLLILGFIEMLDLYTDLVFPVFASTCEPIITKHWAKAWHLVPGAGPWIAEVVLFFEFWRIAIIFVLITFLMSIINLVYFLPQDTSGVFSERQTQEVKRVSSDGFLRLARCANAAMMPSITYLCEEMRAQRRWKLDSARDDYVTRIRAIDDSANGYVGESVMELREEVNTERHETEETEAKCYFTMLLMLKVVAGNCLQLWCQGAFFALAYESVGQQGRAKVMLSMVLSFVMAVVRCHAAAGNIGCVGYLILGFVILFALWIGARTFHVFICEDHVWNLTTGCVATP